MPTLSYIAVKFPFFELMLTQEVLVGFATLFLIAWGVNKFFFKKRK